MNCFVNSGFFGSSVSSGSGVAICGLRRLTHTEILPCRNSGLTHFTGNASSQLKRNIMTAKVTVADILANPKFPEKWPFSQKDFTRMDETDDADFYSQPRFVTHIDDSAINALKQYYAKTVPKDSIILDLCSSWISHFPDGFQKKRAVGLGMNRAELEKNSFLNEFVVQDLNKNPKLPFEDSTFDVITNAVSVDYLMKPQEIFKEMARVLKPGGIAIMSFSNRCFPSKVSQIWLNTSDAGHIFIVGSFFHYADAFQPPVSIDISPNPGKSDPMYIVQAAKKLE